MKTELTIQGESREHKVTVEYEIRTPEKLIGGYDYPKYVDDTENTYIEITDVAGDLPDNFEEQKEDYYNDILEQL